jgi:hypothetical protein
MPLSCTRLPDRSIANGGANACAAIDLRGTRSMALYVGTMTNSVKIRLQGSYDGTTWADMKDTSPAVVEFAASLGGFWMDGDYVARFLMFPWVRAIVSADPGGSGVTLQVILARD